MHLVCPLIPPTCICHTSHVLWQRFHGDSMNCSHICPWFGQYPYYLTMYIIMWSRAQNYNNFEYTRPLTREPWLATTYIDYGARNSTGWTWLKFSCFGSWIWSSSDRRHCKPKPNWLYPAYAIFQLYFRSGGVWVVSTSEKFHFSIKCTCVSAEVEFTWLWFSTHDLDTSASCKFFKHRGYCTSRISMKLFNQKTFGCRILLEKTNNNW